MNRIKSRLAEISKPTIRKRVIGSKTFTKVAAVTKKYSVELEEAMTWASEPPEESGEKEFKQHFEEVKSEINNSLPNGVKLTKFINDYDETDPDEGYNFYIQIEVTAESDEQAQEVADEAAKTIYYICAKYLNYLHAYAACEE